VTTVDLDNLGAETCAYMSVIHPDYSKLAARILVSNLHKQTTSDFMVISKRLKDYKDKAGRPAPLLADDVYAVIEKNID
jgi:ribonucleoside-diphosphate reductase subunit M1